jgi:hypothetical protein
MKMLIVRIQLPNNKLGELVTDVLPSWAKMVGYDLLRADGAVLTNGQDKPKHWQAKPNPDWRPKRNTAGDVVLKLLTKAPMNPTELFAVYKGGKFNHAALSSGLYGLRDRGLIKQQDDGRYQLAVELKKNG